MEEVYWDTISMIIEQTKAAAACKDRYLELIRIEVKAEFNA